MPYSEGRHIGEILKERNIILKGADAATRGGFTQVPNFILKSTKLSAGDKMTFAMLLSYAWQNDYCFPGQERLAQDLGLTDRSVRIPTDAVDCGAHSKIYCRAGQKCSNDGQHCFPVGNLDCGSYPRINLHRSNISNNAIQNIKVYTTIIAKLYILLSAANVKRPGQTSAAKIAVPNTVPATAMNAIKIIINCRNKLAARLRNLTNHISGPPGSRKSGLSNAKISFVLLTINANAAAPMPNS
jgi:hypothetical protein